jgi:hypothetical protein
MYLQLAQVHGLAMTDLSLDSDDTCGAEATSVDHNRPEDGYLWRFPLWQIADRPEFFAYSARNHADGVCVIERINLPDGQVVVACIQVPGNPGSSITNTVETICEQVCRRFDISPDRIVWLENYDFGPDEWDRVTFRAVSADGQFADPVWESMGVHDWEDLRLRPRQRLGAEHGDLISKLEKLFPWPPDDYMVG